MFFFFNETATTEIYTLSLHDALPIWAIPVWVALPGYRILPPEAADTMRLGDAYRTFRLDTDSLLAR